jgi:hypothetical protein
MTSSGTFQLTRGRDVMVNLIGGRDETHARKFKVLARVSMDFICKQSLRRNKSTCKA